MDQRRRFRLQLYGSNLTETRMTNNNNKRKLINHQMSTELAAPITNRSESLKDLSCEKNRTIDPSTSMDSAPTKQEARLPPIYLYDVNNYKAMVDDLSKVVEEETYHSKDLPNNTIKVIPHTPDTYRKIIHHIREARIVHHIPNKAEPSLQNSHSWPPSLYTDL